MGAVELSDQYKYLEKKLRENTEYLLKWCATTDEKLNRLEHKFKQLEEDKRLQFQQPSQIEAKTTNSRDMITLNVGGTLFVTTKSTLLRIEGSYFHAMFASGAWLPNEKGNYILV
jgi:hypothetical protein